MDTQTIAMVGLGVSAANFVLNWGVAFYVHLMNKDKATNDSINEVKSSINVHSERITKLETGAAKAPTHADLEKIHEKINDVGTCVNRLEGEFVGASRTLNLIHETLMEERRK